MRRNDLPVKRCAMRWLAMLVTLLGGGVAQASLGGDQASVLADATSLGVTALATDHVLYRVEECTTAAGLQVREYLGRDGRVFAVGWNGPVAPDMQSLLGAYFVDYAAALAALRSPGLQRAIRLTLPGAVVETAGHLRAYSGRAYLPAGLPAGVALGDLR